MSENNDPNIIQSFEIKQETIDICEEFAENELVLEALRKGATTVKLEEINAFAEQQENIIPMTLRPRKQPEKPKDVSEKMQKLNTKDILKRKLKKIQSKIKRIRKKVALKNITNKKFENKSSHKIDRDENKECKKKLRLKGYSHYNKIDEYKCDLCSFFTPLAKKLRKHKEAKHKKFQCNQCTFQSNSQFIFEAHFFRHQFDRPYICDICSKNFVQKCKLQRHLRTHENIKKHKCPECSLSFLEKSNMLAHRNVHTKIYSHKCHLCHFKTKYRSSLRDHLQSHAGVRTYLCKLCTFKSVTTRALKSHLISHKTEKPYACKQCPYRAKIKDKLKRHLLVHSSRMHFSCGQCSYKTFDESKFQVHYKVHETKSFFPCIICFIIFKKKILLDKHLDRHKLLKDLKCIECNMKHCCIKHRYFDLNQLFVCDICSKSFYKRSSIEKHINRFHQ